ncbi:PAS domain-containing protein [Ekhidna sp.]
MFDPENLDVNSQMILEYLLKEKDLSVFCKDVNSRFFNCNNSFLRDCGVESLTQLIGKTDYDLSWTKEEAASFRLADIEVISNDIFKIGIVEEQTDSSMKKRWIETCKFPLKGEHGKVVGLIGFYTERFY